MRKRWLIRGLILLAVLAAAYSGYWFWLARTFEQQLALWIDQQRAMGYQIEYAATEPTGYPLWIGLQLRDVTAAPTTASPAWRLDSALVPLSLAPWRPLVLHVGERSFPSHHQLRWMAGNQGYKAAIKGLRLAIELSTDEAPPNIDIYDWFLELKQDDRDILAFNGLTGRIEFANAATHADRSIKFDLSSPQVNFFVPSLPQEAIETYLWKIRGEVMGRIPPEPLPHALAAWTEAGGYLTLVQLAGSWELLTDIDVEGSFALDSNLQPIASMTATLRGYDSLIHWLRSIGTITTSQATAARLALGATARPSDDPNFAWESRLPLTIQDGFVSAGAIRLAQLPPIEWQ